MNRLEVLRRREASQVRPLGELRLRDVAQGQVVPEPDPNLVPVGKYRGKSLDAVLADKPYAWSRVAAIPSLVRLLLFSLQIEDALNPAQKPDEQ